MSTPVDPYRAYLWQPTPHGLDAVYDQEIRPPYSTTESAQVQNELVRLFAGQKCKLIFGNRHASPSPTWRDEYIGDLSLRASSRFAVRVHLFEDTSSSSAADPRSRAGKYLGFVCLRPPQVNSKSAPQPKQEFQPGLGFNYVIEAELTCPRQMLRPRYDILQTTVSSARLGVLPFRSATFMTARRGEMHAGTCVHLAVSQALHLIMAHFGSKPISQGEFEAILWKQRAGTTVQQIATKGVGLEEALKVVQEACNAGGFIVDVSKYLGCYNQEAIRRESLRCLTDILANGLPCVLMVEHNTLLRHRYVGDDLKGKKKPQPHALFVFGMHLLHSPNETGMLPGAEVREDEAELPGRFVGHDVLDGAYTEWNVKQLFDAALACPHSKRDKPGRIIRGIRFLALGPKGLQIGLHQVRYLARQIVGGDYLNNAARYNNYYKQFALERAPKNPMHWRYVTRLITRQEVVTRYLSGTRSQQKSQELDRLFTDNAIPLSESDYCWAVELNLPGYQTRRINEPEVRWHPGPLLVQLWSIKDEYAQGTGAAPRASLLRIAKQNYKVLRF